MGVIFKKGEEMSRLSLNAKAKYLVVVDLDQVNPDSVGQKLEEVGIKADVLGIPGARDAITFYEIKRPFWKRWF
jgi:hypothetical protein